MTPIDSLLADALRDRYVLERELGRGGMATVYLAHDLKHNRDVALKFLHPELAARLGTERFLREIQLTARLRHPHILPLFESGEDEGQLWYAMPYVKGQTLRQRLVAEKQLPLEDAVRITCGVLSALAYAHKEGVLHRDIKPENVLLNHGEAVVADFGIAQAASTAGGERLTGTGLTLGTPAYMSPEQAAGERSLGPYSDLYSVAACCMRCSRASLRSPDRPRKRLLQSGFPNHPSHYERCATLFQFGSIKPYNEHSQECRPTASPLPTLLPRRSRPPRPVQRRGRR